VAFATETDVRSVAQATDLTHDVFRSRRAHEAEAGYRQVSVEALTKGQASDLQTVIPANPVAGR